ncbi:MAG: PAS domain S-box protein [Methanomicrobiales archaeon]|nr:PAS domain S-box protein [Methanomicrobiales archaeon]
MIDDAATGAIIDVNDTTLRMYGFSSREEILAYSVGQLSANVPPYGEAGAQELIRRCITQGPQVFLWLAKKKSGELFWTEVTLRKTEIGGEGRILAVIRDITERRAAEEARGVSESRFRELFNTMKSGVAVYEPTSDGKDFIIRDFNPAALDIERLAHGDVIGRRVTEVFPGIAEFGLLDVLIRVARDGRPEQLPTTLYKDQRIVGWRENSVFRLPSGEVVAVYDDVTESRMAEEALRESEEKYRSLADAAQDIIFIIDRDDNVSYLNRFALEQLKMDRAAVIGRPRKDLFPSPVAERQLESIRQVFNTGVQKSIESIVPVRGQDIWMDTRLVPIRAHDGSIIAVMGVSRDITERKAAEQALRQSGERFRALIETSPDLIWEIDITGTILYISPRVSGMLGYIKEEVIGRRVTELVPENLRTGIAQDLQRAAQSGGGIFTIEIPARHRDGSEILIEIRSVIVMGEDGRPAGFRGVGRDITVQKKAGEALRESEEKYRFLVENVNEGIYIAQGNRFIFVNSKSSEITGYSSEELLAMPFMTFIHPDDRDSVRDIIRRRHEGTDAVERFDCRIIRKDGSIRHLESTISTIRYHGADAILGSARDVTKRMEVLRELRFMNVLLTTQQETSPEAILIVDDTGKIVSYNQQFVRIWGVPDNLIRNRDDEPVLSFVTAQQADPELFLERVRYLYKHRDEKSFEELRLRDGRILERFSSPMLGDDRKYYGRVWYFRDITGRRQAEEALRIANRKLTLLSGITRHDIRNQTLSLNAYLDLARQSLGNASEVHEFISRGEQIVRTIEEQIIFTREYEKLGITAPVWQDVPVLLREVAEDMDLTGISYDIARVQKVEVYADALLKNVLRNLVDNALRHSGENLRTIRFTSRVADPDLVITCEDDGVGVPEDDKEVIFERGFGKNTGFGLFFIREVLDITGIGIRENGVPGNGARFEIRVPKGAYRFRD